jgi:hypothetical protein
MYLAIGDSQGSIVLSGGGALIGCTYFPATPTRNGTSFEDVTESGELVLRGSATAIRTAANTIERYFEQAHELQTGGRGTRVYASYTPVSGVDATYRSEILEARLTWSEDPALRRLKDANPTVTVGFTWRRRPYWEGPETEVQLMNSNQSYATGGRTIYNHDDSNTGHDNWVQMNPLQVTGILPAGARIHLINNNGAARTWRRLWVALNAMYVYTHVLEAESRLAGGTTTNSGSASNGQYLQMALNNSSSSFDWYLDQVLLSAGKGRLLRLLAVVNYVGGGAVGVVRASIRDASNSSVLWQGDAVAAPTAPSVLDLGAIPIPPGGRTTATPGALTLRLTFEGTGAWGVDFLQITPTNGLAVVDGLAAVATNGAVVLDSIERQNYVLDASNYQYPTVAVSGQPIELTPNIEQRLIVLAETASGVAIADTLSVRVWVSPRRLVV